MKEHQIATSASLSFGFLAMTYSVTHANNVIARPERPWQSGFLCQESGVVWWLGGVVNQKPSPDGEGGAQAPDEVLIDICHVPLL